MKYKKEEIDDCEFYEWLEMEHIIDEHGCVSVDDNSGFPYSIRDVIEKGSKHFKGHTKKQVYNAIHRTDINWKARQSLWFSVLLAEHHAAFREYKDNGGTMPYNVYVQHYIKRNK